MNNECRLIIFEPQKEPRTVTLLLNEASENTQVLDEYGFPDIEYSILYIEEDSEHQKIQSYIHNWEKNNPISAKKAKSLEKLKRSRELRRKKKEKCKARKIKKRIIESIFERDSDLKETKEEREILKAMKVKNFNLKKILNIKSNKSIDLNTNFNPAMNNKIVLDSTPKGVEYVVLDDSSDDDTNIQLNINDDFEMEEVEDVDGENHSKQEHYENRNSIIPSPSESLDDVVLVDSDSEIECISVHNEVEVLSDSSDVPSKKTRLDEFQDMDESSNMDTSEELPKKKKQVGIVEEFVQDSLNVSQSRWKKKKQNKRPKNIDYKVAPFGDSGETSVLNYNYDSERNNIHIRSSYVPVSEFDEHKVSKNQDVSEIPNSPVRTEVLSDDRSTFEQQSQKVEPELFEGRENLHPKKQQFALKKFSGRGRFRNNRFPVQNIEETTELVQSFFQRTRIQNNYSNHQNMEHVQPNRKFSNRGNFRIERFIVQNVNENEERVQPNRNFFGRGGFQNENRELVQPGRNATSRGRFRNNGFATRNISGRGRFQNNRGFTHNVQKSYEMKGKNIEHLPPTSNAGRFINFRGNQKNQNLSGSINSHKRFEDNSYEQEEYQPEDDTIDYQTYMNQEGVENQNYQPSRQQLHQCKPNQRLQNVQQPRTSNFKMLNPPYRQQQLQNQRNQSSVNQEYHVLQNNTLANKRSQFQMSQQNQQNSSNPQIFSQSNQFQPKRLLPSQNRFQHPKNNAIHQSNNLSQLPNKFRYQANVKNFRNPKFNNRRQYHPFDENYNDQNVQNDVQDYESEVIRNLQTNQNEVNDDEFVWENPEGVDFVPVNVNDPIDPPWSTKPTGGNQYRSLSRRSWVNQHYS